MAIPPLLQQEMKILEKGSYWLKRSLAQCEKIQENNELSEDDYDALEALASRYARVVDILINKTLRALDSAELMDLGSLIDTVNRAEKRGLLDVDTARTVKELRNRIVHEYELEDLADILADIRTLSGRLLAVIEKLHSYVEAMF